MTWLLLFVAFLVGTDAADKLSKTHPQPVGWFEGAVCIALILSAVAIYVWGDDD
jgi:hypothetical protein